MAAAAAAAHTINPSFLFKIKSTQKFPSNPILSMSNSFNKKRLPSSIAVRNSDLQNKDVPFAERIDSWMQDSMVDIVKNLNQAPLLVHIYKDDDRKVRLKTEKAILEKWPVLKGEWANGELKSPDGLIFVDELESDQRGGYEKMMNRELFEEGVSRAWGVVVQGKGVECGPACYLLKTSRVGCEIGFCTHFCLVRVKNFRDSALEQFKDSWLLQ